MSSLLRRMQRRDMAKQSIYDENGDYVGPKYKRDGATRKKVGQPFRHVHPSGRHYTKRRCSPKPERGHIGSFTPHHLATVPRNYGPKRGHKRKGRQFK